LAADVRLDQIRQLPSYPAFLRAFRTYVFGLVVVLAGLIAFGLTENWSLSLIPDLGFLLVFGGLLWWKRRLRPLRDEASAILDAREVNSRAVFAALGDVFRRRHG
jgi:hypothetical protein